MPAPESVVLETSLGNIQLELYWDHAPRVRRLLYLDPGRIYNRQHVSHSADLRELCTAGKARILQRRDISSNHRRMSHDQTPLNLRSLSPC
jgi:hypothetical protein